MPDAFFQRKRKRTDSAGGAGGAGVRRGGSRGGGGGGRSSFPGRGGGARNSRSGRDHDDEATGADADEGDDFFEDGDSDAGAGGARAEDMDLRTRDDGLRSDDEAEAAETPAQARVRLAKMYLNRLKDEDELDGADAVQADRDNIAARLQKDVLEQSGSLHVFLANRLLAPATDSEASTSAAGSQSLTRIVHTRGHRLPVTAAIASADAQMLFTASKDGTIFQWRLQDGKLLTIIPKASKARAAASGHAAGASRSAEEGKSGSTKGKQAGSRALPRSATSGAARRRMRAQKLIALQQAAASAENGAEDGDADADMAGVPNGKPSTTANGASPSTDAQHQRMHFLRLQEGQGHSDAIWALALSSDGRYLASGGLDRKVGLWELSPTSTSTDKRPRWLKSLSGHKDSITSLSFRLHSPELYTASLDRTLKLFDAAQGSYIETLFGHQDPVLSLSALRAEVAVSAGGRDRTCRWWKIRDESQLVFRAGGKSKVREVLEGGDLARILEKDEATAAAASGANGTAQSGGGKGKERAKSRIASESAGPSFVEGSVDCVAMIDDQHFLSGGDSGTLALWSIQKKKPVFTTPVAHGLHETVSETEGTILTPRWITSLSCLPYGDLFASGSWDGHVRLWALDRQLRSFAPLPFTIPAPGFVNSLQLISPTPPKAARSKAAAPPAAGASEDRRVVMEEKWRPSRQGTLKAKETAEDDEDSDDDDDEMSDDNDTAAASALLPELNGHHVPPLPDVAPATTSTSGVNGHSVSATTTKEIRGRKDETAPLLVIGLGQEPRLGRWMRMPEARNGTVVVSFGLQG